MLPRSQQYTQRRNVGILSGPPAQRPQPQTQSRAPSRNNSPRVEDHLVGLLDKKNPYIQAAVPIARKEFNRRGLLNSSMTTGAATGAAIDRALPIAQQNAGYFQDLGRQTHAGGIESGHIEQRGKVQKNLYETQGDITSRIQQEAGDIKSGHISQQGDVDKDVQGHITNLKGDLESRHIGERGNVQKDLTNLKGTIDSRHISERGDIDKDLTNLKGNIQSRHIGEQGNVQKDLTNLQGNIDSRHIDKRIAGQIKAIQHQGAVDKNIANFQAQLKTNLATHAFKLDKKLAAQGFSHERATQETEMAWKKLDLQARMDVEGQRLDDEAQARFNDTTYKIGSEYTKNYLQILADPVYKTHGDRQAAIHALNLATRDRHRVAGKIAGVKLNWSDTVIEKR